MEYVIWGRSEYGTEEVDTAETMSDARYMVREYRLAFGSGWVLWIKRRKVAE